MHMNIISVTCSVEQHTNKLANLQILLFINCLSLNNSSAYRKLYGRIRIITLKYCCMVPNVSYEQPFTIFTDNWIHWNHRSSSTLRLILPSLINRLYQPRILMNDVKCKHSVWFCNKKCFVSFMASQLAAQLRQVNAGASVAKHAKLLDFTNVRAIKFIFNPFQERVESIRYVYRPKFHLARLNSTRHDSTRSTLSRRASRAVLFQHGGRRTSYSARLYKFSRFYALAYTNPICSVK